MEAISKDPFVPALKPDQRTTSIGEAAHRHENDDVGRGGGEIGDRELLDKDMYADSEGCFPHGLWISIRKLLSLFVISDEK